MKLEGLIERYMRAKRVFYIPGIGVLRRVYRDAYLDHRTGTAHPGAEGIAFEAGEVGVDPGWLFFLKKKASDALVQEWERTLTGWQETWRAGRGMRCEGLFSLVKRGGEWAVELESELGLGYWYGLPKIPFYAVNREIAMERMGLPKPRKMMAGVRPEPFSVTKEITMPILATLLVLIGYAMIFLWPGNLVEGPPVHSMNGYEIDDPRVNRSPMEGGGIGADSFWSDEETMDRPYPDQEDPNWDSADWDGTDWDGTGQDSLDGWMDEEMELDEDRPLSEQVPEEVMTKECIVIVGAFKRSANVARMSDSLAAMGYEVHTEAGPRGLTRVGARLECLDEEILDTLAFFRKTVEKEAWVLKW